MASPRGSRSRTVVSAVAAALLAAVVLVGCGSGEAALPAPKESNERPDDADQGGPGSDSDYCQAVADLNASDQDEFEDPATAVETLAALGELAPEELQDAFDVLTGVVDELAALDESDPDYEEQTLDVILQPDLQDAADAIDSYTSDECGIDLEDDGSDDPTTTIDPFDDLDTDDTTAPSSGDINLEDVDAVKEANASSSWVDKLTSTTILNDTAVTLAAESSNPVTVDEAMAACEAVRSALVEINPQVTVEINNGETVVVAAPAQGACAAA